MSCDDDIDFFMRVTSDDWPGRRKSVVGSLDQGFRGSRLRVAGLASAIIAPIQLDR